jgi:hypothetical protein
MLNALTTDQVGYLPIGVYRIDSEVFGGYKDSYTIRGATFNGASVVRSTTSNTIAGSGSKTFTVPAGVGWTTGVGVRVAYRLDTRNWMMGTVASYSGTSLEITVSSSDGSGTFDDWFVSLTYIDKQGGTSAFGVGSTDNDFLTLQGVTGTDQAGNTGIANWVQLSGSPAKGDTTVTVSSATGLSIGQLCQVLIDDEKRESVIEAGGAIVIGLGGSGFTNQGGTGNQGALRRQMNRIANLSGTTVTLEVPLAFDLPAALTPRLLATSNIAQYVGIEDMWIGTDTNTVQNMNLGYNCWYYNIYATTSTGFFFQTYNCFKSEIRHCWASDRITSGGVAGGGGIAPFFTASCLFEDNVTHNVFPGFEVNNNSTANAILYNYVKVTDDTVGPGALNSNHGPHNSYNLYEGNRAAYLQSDGFHGSGSDDTLLRNWLAGSGVADSAFIVLNRFTRRYNMAGNVIGTPSVSDGLFSYGNPNIGNQEFFGTVQPSVDGTWWRHHPETGIGSATVANATTGELTLLGGLEGADYANGGDYIGSAGQLSATLHWATGWRSGLTYTSHSGTSLTLDPASGSGNDFPANSTTVYIYPGQHGFQERDLDTQNTAVEKGNYLVVDAGGAMSSLGGDTLSNSYAYGSTPSWWRTSLTYPPYNPVSPTFSEALTPSGYRFVNGEEAPLSGGSTSLTATNSTTTNLILP